MIIIDNFEGARWSGAIWERDDDSTTWRATGRFKDEVYDLIVVGGPNSSEEVATCEVSAGRGDDRIVIHKSVEANWHAATDMAEDVVRAIAAEGAHEERTVMADITKIPTEEFPLNFERYNRLMNELRDAARGFERLGSMGWPGGKDLDRRLMAIWSDLGGVWETIQETERQMRAGGVSQSDG